MSVYTQPRKVGAKVEFKARYENWIDGEGVPPTTGRYVKNLTPVTGRAFTEAAPTTAEGIELALEAAHNSAPGWGRTPVADRAPVLNRIADRIMDNLELLAVAETWDPDRLAVEPRLPTGRGRLRSHTVVDLTCPVRDLEAHSPHRRRGPRSEQRFSVGAPAGAGSSLARGAMSQDEMRASDLL
jgi:Aldehyde dehydrogenase family